MNKIKYIFLICVIFMAGCETIDRQQGGSLKVNSPLGGSVNVQQAENAKEAAKMNYNEDTVSFTANPEDELNVIIDKSSDGSIKKEIKFKPKNKSSDVTITNVNADGNTGHSWEDTLGQLKVFMQNTKFIMWVGTALLAGGVLFGFITRDIRVGAIIAGTGAGMLGCYALLPQIYANWALVFIICLLAIPVVYYLHYKRTERIARASVKAHEALKIKNPELAKEHAKNFKEHIKPSDINHAKKFK